MSLSTKCPARADYLFNTGIKPVVLEQIRGHAKKYGIHKVILFGSRARGAFHRDSDIDLAVSGRNADLFRSYRQRRALGCDLERRHCSL